MSKISVLVAIYNGERYLSHCLDSLVSQTLRDIQIVCIDDGSTDRSPDIVQSYADRDKRIVLLCKPQNEGPAKARNAGLNIADGEFVTMVDSDDWIDEDALARAYDEFVRFPRTDAVLFTLKYYDEANKTVSLFPTLLDKKLLTGDEAFRLSLDWRIHGLYVVRTELNRSYPYDETTRLYSDDNTSRLHYLHSREVRLCSGVYYYRQYGASATHVNGVRRYDLLPATRSLKRIVEENLPEKDLLRQMEVRLWVNTVGLYGYYLRYKSEYTTDEAHEIREMLHDCRRNIVLRRLPLSLRCKFGYIPFRHAAWLFALQEHLYFGLRRALFALRFKKDSLFQ